MIAVQPIGNRYARKGPHERLRECAIEREIGLRYPGRGFEAAIVGRVIAGGSFVIVITGGTYRVLHSHQNQCAQHLGVVRWAGCASIVTAITSLAVFLGLNQLSPQPSAARADGIVTAVGGRVLRD
jgi:hypothetical protein